jgi:nucleoside 2-deoxyribosyltransferase
MNEIKKRIYVAASWNDRTSVKAVMLRLEKLGYEIAEDWTPHEDKEKTLEYCELDIKGVETCDLFVLMNSNRSTTGKFIETGMAIALGKPVISFGEKVTTVFKHRIKRHFDTYLTSAEFISSVVDQFAKENIVAENDE